MYSKCCRPDLQETFVDCFSLNNPHLRTCTPLETPSSIPSIYFPLPNDTADKELMMVTPPLTLILRNIMNDDPVLKLEKPPYTVNDLPPFPDIATGTKDTCYLVQYKNPGKFYIILNLQGNLLYQMDNEQWKKYFPKRIPMKVERDLESVNFQSSLGLFRGLVTLLSMIMQNAQNIEEINTLNYQEGNLVICAVPRAMAKQVGSSTPETGVFGYRGVITKELKLATFKNNQSGKELVYKYLLIYLVDIGEYRIVEKGVGFLAPLPEAFIGFPPMAIHCALHGISSPGGVDWTMETSLAVNKLIQPQRDDGGRVQLVAEFMCKSPSTNNFQGALKGTCATLLYSPPVYFIELVAVCSPSPLPLPPPKGKKKCLPSLCSNVSTELIKKNKVFEWNMFPEKPDFCREYFQYWYWKELKGYPVTVMQANDEEEANPDQRGGINTNERGIVLHVSRGGSHRKFPDVDMVGIKHAILNSFLANPKLDKELIKFTDSEEGYAWEGNTISLTFISEI